MDMDEEDEGIGGMNPTPLFGNSSSALHDHLNQPRWSFDNSHGYSGPMSQAQALPPGELDASDEDLFADEGRAVRAVRAWRGVRAQTISRRGACSSAAS